MVMALADAPWRSGTIALVGNATSLRETSFGPEIDQKDCVIRINQGAFVPLSAEATGLRTDALFMTLPGYAWDKVWMYGRGRRKAKTVVAMSPKGRTFLGIELSRLIPAYPLDWHRELAQTLTARPSTGAMAVDLLLRTAQSPGHIHLYGFDFWTTPTTYTGIAKPSPHDPEAEERYIRSHLPESNIHLAVTRP